MTKYTKYLTNHIFVGMTILGFLLGGHWLWLGFVFAIVGSITGDFLLGEHGEAPEYKHPQILSLIMYSYFPMIILCASTFIWTIVPTDILEIGAAVSSLTGYDVLMAKSGNQIFDLIGGALGLGLMFAITNVIMAHELIHRTWDPVAMFFGRWFFGIAGGIPFETEHVYGHHITLGQPHDASLSLRKDSYYAFLFSAPFKQIAYAWMVEKKRLAKYDHSVFWIGNKMIRAGLRATVVWAIVFTVGGWIAVGLYTISFLMSKMMYEAIGYQFHHGQVCAAGQPDGDRHSWNCNRLMSQVILFNVTKHSEHHRHPDRPFHELAKVIDGEAPLLQTGVVTNAFLAYFPPLQRMVIGPQILQWDKDFATEEEKQIAVEQNRASGISVYAATATS